jgi:hypothetical protein
MPVPTLGEVLKKSGWTQEQIDALDAKAVSGLTTVLTTASQAEEIATQKEKEAVAAAAKAEIDRKAAEDSAAAARAAQEAAELSKRSVDEFWHNTYNPGIAQWEKDRIELTKKANDAAAEAAFYKTQREGYLKDLKIDPANAPAFVAPTPNPADPQPTKTPGTPQFVDPNVVVSRVGDGMNEILNIQWKYQSLYGGAPIPVSPSELISQATALKLSPMEYASRTFKFAEKEEERRVAAAKAHDDQVAAAATAAKDEAHKIELQKLQDDFNAKEKLRAEQAGSNGDVRLPPGSSKFADLRRATSAGERPDPTKMTQAQRRELTINNIHKAVEEREQAVA